MSNRLITITAILAVAALFMLGMFLWGILAGGNEVGNTTCQGLGFDGQIVKDAQVFCYIACPYDMAVSGECQPGDSGVGHVNPGD